MSHKSYVRRLKFGPELARARDLYQAGDYHGCVSVLEKVLHQNEANALAWFTMGLCFEAISEPLRALYCLNRSVKIKPNNAEAWYNKGVTEAWLGRFEEAHESYKRALKLDPFLVGAWTNLGNVLMAKGLHDEAIQAYDRSASLNPTKPEAIHNRSMVYLLRGQWEQGWKDYEVRDQLPGHAYANPMPPGVPRWRGEPLEGKTILVLQEQGSGDTLMMLRYVPGLVFQGARVILRVPEPMMRLVRYNFPQCEVEEYVHPDNPKPQPPWPQCDYVIPFMSLPLVFGTTPDTVPFSDGPYLIAPPEAA